MPEISKDEMEGLLSKYKNKLSSNLTPESEATQNMGVVRTREYGEFKAEYLPPHMNWYEKAVQFTEKLIKLKPPPKKAALLKESIEVCHINVTPEGAYTFALLAPLVFAMMGMAISLTISSGMFFPIFFMIMGVSFMGPLGKIPMMMAGSWRMKASNQMVLSIFYVVTYMRHTSNLELAIDFAAEHLAPPLSLDLKRVIWNIETGKFDSVKESLDAYLSTWKKYNMEYVESFHLVQGSLFESSEDRRLEVLDKGLSVILQETFEKMLHYAQNLKGPITTLHMLGIILPILGLVILPLVVSFMNGVAWYHIATLYNIILPLGVLYLGKTILASRPTGYGDTDITEIDPSLKKLKKVAIKFGGSEILVNPIYISIAIFVVCFSIAMTPLIIHFIAPGWDFVMFEDGRISQLETGTYDIKGIKFALIGYKGLQADPDIKIGPFGLGASLISVFMPLSVGLAVGFYYRARTKNVLSIRNKAKKLEKEFASALFQLGNRIGDGLPAEIAFQKVAVSLEGTVSASFFETVAGNIARLGMSVEQAIFDPRIGGLVQYPSNLIESSMKVLIESAKKGPQVAAQALINVSRYIKEMHSVDERLKDLMSESISSMKAQIAFLTPVIAGIVIGITSMVTTILNKLSGQLARMQTEGAAAGQAGSSMMVTSLFGDGLPTFYFQIVVGFYVVQIVFILTSLTNGIENGSDKLQEQYLIGKNMTRSTIMYCIISLVVMLLFNSIAGTIISGTG